MTSKTTTMSLFNLVFSNGLLLFWLMTICHGSCRPTLAFAPMIVVSKSHALKQRDPTKFLVTPTTRTRTTTKLHVVDPDKIALETILDTGYLTACEKPLGIILAENDEPFSGLVVSDIFEGQNAAKAGIRIGDQLMSINGRVVIGRDFDSVMDLIKTLPSPLEIQLYRGTVRALYTIVANLQQEEQEQEQEEEEEEEEEAVVMDEDYESPVTVDLADYEEKPITLDTLFRAAKKVGDMISEGAEEAKAQKELEQKQEDEDKKKKGGGGFFDMFKQETIQLEGDEASGLKGQKRK